MLSSSVRIRSDSALGFFLAQIDLDQHVEGLSQLLGGSVESLGQLRGVEGIDRVKYLGRLRRLVGLQMPDHVELGIAQFRESANLFRELLHAVLAEQAVSCFVGLNDGRSRKRLGHRHERNVVRVASGPLRGKCDAVVEGSEIGGDGHRARVEDSCKL